MELGNLVLNKNVGEYPPNSWVFGKNIIISRDGKAILNERGLDEYASLNMTVIGSTVIGTTIILFSCNEILSEIGIIVDNNYSTVIREFSLGFNLDYPILAEATYNHKNEIITSWTDDNISPKILNLTDLPFPSGLNPDFSLVNRDEFTLCELFPNVKNYTIEAINVLDTGGTLPSGVYNVTIAYIFDDNSSTIWQELSSTIHVVKAIAAEVSNFYTEYDGCAAGTKTSKCIKLSFSGLDTNFTKFKIGIVFKNNGVITAYESSTYYYGSNSKDVTITDIDTLSQIDIKEILVGTAVYNKARAITLTNNRLLLGNLSSIPILDYQSYANDIQVQWSRESFVSIDAIKSSYKDSSVLFFNKSFKSGEVIALYIALRLKQGGYYGVWTLPGREVLSNELDNVTSTAPYSLLGGEVRRYQVEDTSTDDSGTGEYGQMGYWENVNEQYPSAFPDFANQNVRHHRFPELAELESRSKSFSTVYTPPAGSIVSFDLLYPVDHIITTVVPNLTQIYFGNTAGTLYGSFNSTYTKYTADRNQNVDITGSITMYKDPAPQPPQTIYLEIFRYRLGVPTRLYYQADSAITSPITFNLNYTGIGLDNTDVLEIRITTLLKIQSYSVSGSLTFDINEVSYTLSGSQFTKPLGLRISNVVIPNEIKEFVDGWEIFYAERTVQNMTHLGQDMLYGNQWWDSTTPTRWDLTEYFKFHAFDLMVNQLAIQPTYLNVQLDYTTSNSSEDVDGTGDVVDYTGVNYVDLVGSSFRIIPCKGIRYLPAYIDSIDYDNTHGEDGYLIHIDPTILASVVFTDEHRYFADLCVYKTDLYSNYQDQFLVSTGKIIRIDPTKVVQDMSIIQGGDCVINPYGYKLIEFTPTIKNLIPYILCESISNIGFRYEGPNEGEEYYPKSPGMKVMATDGVAAANTYFYNNDYNGINSYIQPIIDYPNINRVDTFPFRIIRSLPKQTESVSLNWRKFLVTDYFEMTSNKGYINKLTADTNKSLYIAHKYALFVAKIKDSLDTQTGEIYLKEGDLFDREPTEVIPITGGYIGNQSRFATFISKYGYFTIDIERGKVFLISNTVEEISKFQCDEFFETHLNTGVNILNADNDLLSSDGVTLDYSDSDELLVGNNLLSSPNYKDNPFVGAGLTAGFDDVNDRFIITSNARHYSSIQNGNSGNTNNNDNPIPEEEIGFGIIDTDWDLGLLSYTISYHVTKKTWVAFHDYLINHYINTRTGLLGVHNFATLTPENFRTTVYKFNSTSTFSKYEDVIYSSYLDYVSNKPIESLLHSISWSSIINNGNLNYWDKTITHLIIYTLNQCSNEIIIVPQTWANQMTTGNAKLFKGNWTLNAFKDKLMSNSISFIDNNQNLLLEEFAEESATSILVGRKYKVSGISVITDYITYNSVVYNYNDAEIVPIAGITTFTINGNAVVKNFKNWFENSNIFTKFAVIRLKYDNTEQLNFKLTDISINER